MKQVQSNLVYSNPWIRVYQDTVAMENGKTGEYGVVRHNAPSVVAVVLNNARLLMVKAHRYVLGRESEEFPAGSLEEGERCEAAAIREVQEETGVFMANCRRLLTYLPSNGTSDQVMHVVAGEYQEGTLQPQQDEVSCCYWRTPEEVLQKIQQGEVTDGPTITALYCWLHHKG